MIDPLIQQLQSPDPDQRRQAIMALANNRNPAALPALATVYRDDPDPALRDLAFKAGRYIRQSAPASAGTTGSAFGAGPADAGAASPVSARDAELARKYLNFASTHHIEGDRARAVEHLGKALSLNPDLIKETFVENLIMATTGMAVNDAVPLLIYPDRRAALIAQMGGKQKLKRRQEHGRGADTATWDNVMTDFGIYWLATTLSMIVIFVAALNAIRDWLDTLPRSSASTTVALDDLMAVSIIGWIILAVFFSIISAISLAIQGGAIHLAATVALGGDGTLVYLYRRIVPFNTIVTVSFVALFLALMLFGSTVDEVFFLVPLAIGAGVFGALYYLAELVAQVYDFGWWSGCGAIILGGILLEAISCYANTALASLLSGLMAQ